MTPESGGVSHAECPFCAILEGRAPAKVVRSWPDSLAIAPLTAVTAGHTLVIPRIHVADVGVDPAVSAATMRRAAELASEIGSCNIITSRGELATQSVFHLHLHVLPRRPQDGLALPWSSGSGEWMLREKVAGASDIAMPAAFQVLPMG
ncbi:HIT family protein [Streptomyces calvus]|uniref:HIT family protein n=1 Tax=Streptomyces calvus TaxID=67282 RepID=UPI001ABEF424|nr:HIT domain-containing protein [Streptomyces calvus]